MKNKIQNSIKFLKRFFEPALMDKKEALKSLAMSIVTLLRFDVVPLVALPILLNAIQAKDVNKIIDVSIISIALVFTLTFIHYNFLLGWYWYAHRKMAGEIEGKYRKLVLLKDNLFFEKNGTGKIQSIIQNGVDIWSKACNDSIRTLLRLVILMFFGIYMMAGLGWYYSFIYVILMVVFTKVYFLMRDKRHGLEMRHRELRNKFNDNSVRTILSRTEILYTGNADKESRLLKSLKYKEHEIGVESDWYSFWAVNPAETFFVLLPFLGAIAYLNLSSSVDFAQATTFVYFASRMSFGVWEFLSFYASTIQNWPDIKKLWDFIDNVPQLKNYEEGKVFTHEKGEIELRNISFSYEK